MVRLKNNKAFTLIELAVALAIIGLIILGFFQLTASMTRQSQDRQTAIELRRVTEAVQTYMSAIGSETLNNGDVAKPPIPQIVAIGAGTGRRLSADELTYIQNTYLTAGTQLATAVPPYTIYMRNLGNVNGTFNFQALVLRVPPAPAANPSFRILNDTRGASIAAQAGNGGFIYSDSADIVGSKGSWRLNAAQTALFGVPANTTRTGTLASLTGSTSGVAITSNMLSRVNTGNVAANTMMTDLTMNTNTNIRMGQASGTSQTADIIMGATKSNIDMNGGAALAATGGTIKNLKQGLQFMFPSINSTGYYLPTVGNNCGDNQVVTGLDPDKDASGNPTLGYKNRLAIGRNKGSATGDKSPILVFCTLDAFNTNTYSWKTAGPLSPKAWREVPISIGLRPTADPTIPGCTTGNEKVCWTRQLPKPSVAITPFKNNSTEEIIVNFMIYNYLSTGTYAAIFVDDINVMQGGGDTVNGSTTLTATISPGSEWFVVNSGCSSYGLRCRYFDYRQ